MRGRLGSTAFDWLFLNAKEPNAPLYGQSGTSSTAEALTLGYPASASENARGLMPRPTRDLASLALYCGSVLVLPEKAYCSFTPFLLDTMPRPRKYSIEEVLNFTVKDIQGSK